MEALPDALKALVTAFSILGSPFIFMLLFIDESGTDHKAAPYEVLAGAAVSERDLWNLIQAIQSAQKEFFGVLLPSEEFKGRSLLKRKTFRLARQMAEMVPDERSTLARQFLAKGDLLKQGLSSPMPTRREFTAYGQAILAFVHEIFDLCPLYRVKFFASIVDPAAPRPEGARFLRKDYAYLFERFFYYLEDTSATETGIIVFDEFDKAQCRILLDQVTNYFLRTEKGKARSGRILPEPFFVHSDLTTAIQLADIAAYCINWGVRQLREMKKPARDEMKLYGRQVFDLRYVGKRFDDAEKREWPVYGFSYIDDLRTKETREASHG